MITDNGRVPTGTAERRLNPALHPAQAPAMHPAPHTAQHFIPHPALQSAAVYITALEAQLTCNPCATHAADQQLLAHLLEHQLAHIDNVLGALQQPAALEQHREEVRAWHELRGRLAALLTQLPRVAA